MRICAATAAVLLALGPAVQARAYVTEYDSFGRRDPFVPLVGVPKEQSRGGLWGITSVDEISLQGILINPDGTRSAIMNGELMGEGQTIDLLKVNSIGGNTVIVTLDSERHEIKLYE
jgi:hypothetical protein